MSRFKAFMLNTFTAAAVAGGMYIAYKKGRADGYGSAKKAAERASSDHYENEVAKILARYDGSELPQNHIVFYGSSSIRLWDTIENDMAPLPALRHGFGGAFIDDMFYYADKLLFPFKPKAMVFYCGTNDMSSNIPHFGKNAVQTYRETVRFFDFVHTRMPDLPIYYIPSTPNPRRWDIWFHMDTCNQLMKSHCAVDSRLHYIDTVPYLLDENGMCREELFKEDLLHFNGEGYKVWTSVIKPVLMKDFSENI